MVKHRRSIKTLLYLFKGSKTLHKSRGYLFGIASMDEKLFYIFKNLLEKNFFHITGNEKTIVCKIGIEKEYMGSLTIPMMYSF